MRAVCLVLSAILIAVLPLQTRLCPWLVSYETGEKDKKERGGGGRKKLFTFLWF